MNKRKGRTVALIPLRGGSKSIPNKNLKALGGKPLAYWVCRAAEEAHGIDAVYVSTEDAAIKAAVESFGGRIQVIDRPSALAQDTSSTESVMLHFAEMVSDWDVLVTLQATSPLTTALDIDTALAEFSEEGFDSMLSGVRTKRFFWTNEGQPLNYDFRNRPRRQDFSGSVVENGAFYITKREVLETHRCRLGGNIGIFMMPDDTLTELDAVVDWDVVEKLLLAREQ